MIDRRRPTRRLTLSLLVGFGGLVLLPATGPARAEAIDAAAVLALAVAPIT